VLIIYVLILVKFSQFSLLLLVVILHVKTIDIVDFDTRFYDE
jgi:hypothetical protein